MYFLSCNIIFLGTIVDHIKANLANTKKKIYIYIIIIIMVI